MTRKTGGDDEWGGTLDPNVTAYLKSDGTKIETCGVFSSGTVCLAGVSSISCYSSDDGYSDDFTTCSESGAGEFTSSDIDDSCLTGYSLAKAKEMLNKGASSCQVYDYQVNCLTADVNNYCSIYDNGYVNCYPHGVNPDGPTDNYPAP